MRRAFVLPRPTYPDFSGAQASSHRLGFVVWTILAYLALTRVGGLRAAKLGIAIGGAPIFLTEIFIVVLGLTMLFARFERLTFWIVSGWGAGVAGIFAWALTLSAVVYGALAFPTWGILAARDLAIFAYAVLFPLAYIALDTRMKARAVLNGFIALGVVLSIALMFDAALFDGALYGDQVRGFTNQNITVRGFGGGDIGGMVSFSLAGLLALALRPRGIILLGVVLCAMAFVMGQTRSAVVGLSLAAGYLFLAAPMAWRGVLILAAALAIGTGAAIVELLPGTEFSRIFQGFYLAVVGGAGLTEDGTFAFRVLRWNIVFDLWLENPIFGVGFGVPITPEFLIVREDEDGLNAGMPHNSYLTILARMGLLGFVLIGAPWIWSAARCWRRYLIADRKDNDALAAGAILVAMAGFAPFVLFIERPIHNAALWIMMAVACRLSENADAASP